MMIGMSASCAAITAVGLIVLGGGNGIKILPTQGSESDYSNTFDKTTNKIGTDKFVSPSTVFSGSGFATTGLGNRIGFDYNSFANPTTVWRLISGGGYFTNTDPISGMRNISLTKANTSSTFQIFWSETKTFSDAHSATYDSTSALSFTCDFGGYSPNYLKVLALGTGKSTITSGSILFSCANQYPELTLNQNLPGAGSASGAGSYAYKSSITLTAMPKTGYSFAGFYDRETLVSSANPYAFTMPHQNLNYTAKFTINHYQASLSSTEVATTPLGSCSVGGDGTYAYGSSVTISAAPSAGYGFLGWYNGDTLVSRAKPICFLLTTIFRRIPLHTNKPLRRACL